MGMMGLDWKVWMMVGGIGFKGGMSVSLVGDWFFFSSCEGLGGGIRGDCFL